MVYGGGLETSVSGPSGSNAPGKSNPWNPWQASSGLLHPQALPALDVQADDLYLGVN